MTGTAFHAFVGVLCAGVVLLNAPSAQAQNLFVSSDADNTITEFTPGGVQSTFASGLDYPHGLAFNSAGDLFEADFSSGNIYEFTPGGARSTFATGLHNLTGLAFNSAGDLFVASESYGVYEYTLGGARSTFATGINPFGLAFNSAGDLFVSSGGTIIEITPGGVQSTFFASALSYFTGLAFNSAGDLFVADNTSNNSIDEFTPDGGQKTFASQLYLSAPVSLAFNSAGDLFVGSSAGPWITEITPDGTQIPWWTGSLYGAESALAFQPVPEPSCWALLAGAATALLIRRCRR
jgi:hypothetical protein